MSASNPTTGRKARSVPNIQCLPLGTKEAAAVRRAIVERVNAPRYVPEFTGAIEGWVVNFLKDNLWRVQRTMDRDDCLQEARLVFLRVARTYPNVTDAPHFMALFKTSWTRRFNDLSTEDSAIREQEISMYRERSAEEEGPGLPSDYIGDVSNEGELRIMLRQAPHEVSMFLNLMLRAPQEVIELALASWKGRDRRMRAGGSERINRLLGLPEDHDLLGQTERYFRGE